MTSTSRRAQAASAGSALLVIAALVALGSRVDSQPAVDAASHKCIECHEELFGDIARSGHRVDTRTHVTCVSCHAGSDGAHSENPDDHAASDPVQKSFAGATSTCLACHPGAHAANLLERDPHGAAEMACGTCHTVHDNHRPGLLAADQPALCVQCHPSVAGDFHQPYRHPVPDGGVRCSDCHLQTAESHKQLLYAGASGACIQCHGRMQGPFPFEHQASVDYSTEEGGCMNCHAAHGSSFPRMLKQHYGGGNNALCSQCHVTPGHQNNPMHGTQWAGVPCEQCHTDLHGSYTSRHLLDASLSTQGCFNAGCHQP